MKVLFICQANAARSQIARALFDDISRHSSESAGTNVMQEGGTLGEALDHPSVGEYVRNILEAMAEEGHDLSGRRRLRLTESMVKEADRVVVMAPTETWPGYLKTSEQTVVWDVPDPREMTSIEHVRQIRDSIKDLIEELVAEIG